ncbi:MAG: N-acetylmuramoyl-L-alanine amidase [Nannocystales bacterium]
MGDETDEDQDADTIEDSAEEDATDDADHGDVLRPVEPGGVLHAGTALVAPSSDGSTGNVLAAPTSIRVTLRRDFPLRRGERLGEWAWSSADGSVQQDPQRWTFEGEDGEGGAPPPDEELESEDDRPIFGWGIGRPSLGEPGDNAGQLTTDRSEVIAATVRLRNEDGDVLSEGNCTGRDGACLLATASSTGVFTVDITPERITEDTAGPGMRSDHLLLYKAASVNIELRGGRLVGIEDPYDPPNAQTHARVGNRQVWTPTTTQLPLSLKPQWWKDPGSRARRGGTGAISMLVLHCTGGSRVGGPLNDFFGWADAARTRRKTKGANYLLDIDGHAIKLTADDRTKVHAGVGRWGGDRDIVNHSLGIEIINPNTGEPDDYMARAKTPYTEEQYATILRLAREITEAYPTVGSRVLGHCDVATGNARRQTGVPRDTYHRKRRWDPGLHFEWERLEHAGLGMVPAESFDPATAYGGVFTTVAGLELDRGDADARGRRAAHYGGVDRPDHAPEVAVIEQLQTDLRTVGYSLRITGAFDARTFAAADRFRRHFARQGMTSREQGAIDLAVAERLYNAAAALRPPVATPLPPETADAEAAPASATPS